MKSSVLYRPIQVNKAYEKIVALSTDEINTDCLANGSLLYLMDTDKYMIWDEENKKFLEYVSPQGGDGEGGVNYTGYPVATQTSHGENKYKFQDDVDVENYLKTFAPYILALRGLDGSTSFSCIIYPNGTSTTDANYTIYDAVAIDGSYHYNVSLRLNEDKTITSVSNDDYELWLPKPPSERYNDYVLITPHNSLDSKWKDISTLPSFLAAPFDNEIMQQLVTAMKQLAAATPNTAVTKYIPLEGFMQQLASRIIELQQQYMIDNSRVVAAVLHNTTSLAMHVNNSEGSSFASFIHKEVDFNENKIYDFTFIFSQTKCFIQCTCSTADVLPMG